MNQRDNWKNDEGIVWDANAGLGPSESRSFSASMTVGESVSGSQHIFTL